MGIAWGIAFVGGPVFSFVFLLSHHIHTRHHYTGWFLFVL